MSRRSAPKRCWCRSSSRDNGEFVRGLKKQDFELFEDGVAQTVASFVNENAPLDLVLAVDISGSMESSLVQVKAAVKQLLSKLRTGDAATLVGFNDTFFIAAEREKDRADAREGGRPAHLVGRHRLVRRDGPRARDGEPRVGPQRGRHLLRRRRSPQPHAPRDRDGARAGQRRDALHRGIWRGSDRAGAAEQPRDLRAIHRRARVLSPERRRSSTASSTTSSRSSPISTFSRTRRPISRPTTRGGTSRSRCGKASTTSVRGRVTTQTDRNARGGNNAGTERHHDGGNGGAAGFVRGPLLAGRQVRPEQAPTFRSGVEVVTIDVGVVDRQGQPLRGLGPADFTVSVGGQPRRVVSAEFVDTAVAAAGSASAVRTSPRSAPTRGAASAACSCSSSIRARSIPAARGTSRGRRRGSSRGSPSRTDRR